MLKKKASVFGYGELEKKLGPVLRKIQILPDLQKHLANQRGDLKLGTDYQKIYGKLKEETLHNLKYGSSEEIKTILKEIFSVEELTKARTDYDSFRKKSDDMIKSFFFGSIIPLITKKDFDYNDIEIFHQHVVRDRNGTKYRSDPEAIQDYKPDAIFIPEFIKKNPGESLTNTLHILSMPKNPYAVNGIYTRTKFGSSLSDKILINMHKQAQHDQKLYKQIKDLLGGQIILEEGNRIELAKDISLYFTSRFRKPQNFYCIEDDIRKGNTPFPKGNPKTTINSILRDYEGKHIIFENNNYTIEIDMERMDKKYDPDGKFSSVQLNIGFKGELLFPYSPEYQNIELQLLDPLAKGHHSYGKYGHDTIKEKDKKMFEEMHPLLSASRELVGMIFDYEGFSKD